MIGDNELQKLTQQESMRRRFHNTPGVMFPTRIAVVAAASYGNEARKVLVDQAVLSQHLPYAGSARLPGRATREGVRRVAAPADGGANAQ